MNIQIMETVLNGEKINSVNAREIHDYLEVKTHLSTWIQRAIEKYDFVENIDFSILKSDYDEVMELISYNLIIIN